MDTLTRLKGLSDEHKTKVWQVWPDDIPKDPGTWTDAHRLRIDSFIDRLTGFNADADPAVLGKARQRVAAAVKAAHLDAEKPAVQAVADHCGADMSTVAGLELLARTLDRVATGELVVHINDDDTAWCVTEAGQGSDLEHRQAVTAASTTTGEWTAVVTIQHPAGHFWSTKTITGTLAHHIANKINEQENQ